MRSFHLGIAPLGHTRGERVRLRLAVWTWPMIIIKIYRSRSNSCSICFIRPMPSHLMTLYNMTILRQIKTIQLMRVTVRKITSTVLKPMPLWINTSMLILLEIVTYSRRGGLVAWILVSILKQSWRWMKQCSFRTEILMRIMIKKWRGDWSIMMNQKYQRTGFSSLMTHRNASIMSYTTHTLEHYSNLSRQANKRIGKISQPRLKYKANLLGPSAWTRAVVGKLMIMEKKIIISKVWKIAYSRIVWDVLDKVVHTLIFL